MISDYDRVVSVSPERFEEAWKRGGFDDSRNFTRSDAEDVERIENLLDVRRGVLSGIEYLADDHDCPCGRKMTFYDFVFTALVDRIHTKSFMVHTLLGEKLVINAARKVRCSNCATLSDKSLRYGMPSSYLCIDPVADPNPPA